MRYVRFVPRLLRLRIVPGESQPLRSRSSTVSAPRCGIAPDPSARTSPRPGTRRSIFSRPTRGRAGLGRITRASKASELLGDRAQRHSLWTASVGWQRPRCSRRRSRGLACDGSVPPDRATRKPESTTTLRTDTVPNRLLARAAPAGGRPCRDRCKQRVGEATERRSGSRHEPLRYARRHDPPGRDACVRALPRERQGERRIETYRQADSRVRLCGYLCKRSYR